MAWWEGQTGKPALLRRAAFDLSCPQEQLQLAGLGSNPNDPYKVVGVSGCGKKSTYANVQVGARYEWVMNSDTKPDK